MKIFKHKALIYFFRLLILFSLEKFCFATNDGPTFGGTYNGRVNFLREDDSDVVVNPFVIYNRSIVKYFMPRALNNVILHISGRDYPLNLAAATREAMDEWESASNQRIKFEPAVSINSASLIISTLAHPRPSTPQEGNMTLAEARHASPPNQPAVLVYYRGEIEGYLSNPSSTAEMNFIMGSGASINDRLQFLIKHTAKHELGHVLGLHHADLLERSHPGIATIIPSYLNPGVPIMAPGDSAWEDLRNHLGRNLTINDIRISDQESAALEELYQATEHGCSCCVISYRDNYTPYPNPDGTKKYICPDLEDNFNKALSRLRITNDDNVFASDNPYLPGLFRLGAELDGIFFIPYHITQRN